MQLRRRAGQTKEKKGLQENNIIQVQTKFELKQGEKHNPESQ